MLPDFNRPHTTYPKKLDLGTTAVLQSQALFQQLAQKYAVQCNSDWWQAAQLADDEKRAEADQRAQQLAKEKGEAEREFHRHLLAADRRRRGLVNGG